MHSSDSCRIDANLAIATQWSSAFGDDVIRIPHKNPDGAREQAQRNSTE